jgi:alpha-galactosidase/6-phospho-beta-glucosidase family protein
MPKITFIGGGSVLWIPDLLSDIALTPTLSGAQIVLQDIVPGALQRILPVARRIVKQTGADLQITATLDRAEALRGADFVVLCVSIGGLEAMRSDLEIPLKYGIYQSVGDTVGPGGWARGLRHIPFAVQVAREMEQLCPQAWLLNLTNPMTVICRAVTKATPIRTIGLCHEVAGVRAHLSGLFNVPLEQVIMGVAGINHLPVILDCRIGEKDGLAMLREYLVQHDPLEGIDRSEMNSPYQVFFDQLALKFTLFQQTGILYGAGDRHVAEFFPGFLTEATQHGLRYGIHLTTVEHRLAMLQQNRTELADYQPPGEVSTEQLAPLMAALLGGPPGRFVVNVPNRGQIDSLPCQPVVECMAYVDRSGVWPLAVGDLPPAAQEVIAGHVQRQEWIVEAALTGHLDLARLALAGDPLVNNPAIVEALFAELTQANTQALEKQAVLLQQMNTQSLVDVENPQTVAEAVQPPPVGFSVDHTPIGQLMEDTAAHAVLEKHFGALLNNPQLKLAYGMTFKSVARYAPLILTRKKLLALDQDLKKIPRP